MRKTASALLAVALLGASVCGETMSFAPVGTLTVSTNIAITGTTTVDVASGTVVFAGVISGSGGLTKSGSCTLYLADRANTYDGLITVSGGALY